jgi:DNA-directed RNA polymerase specialized sigma24 family protein
MDDRAFAELRPAMFALAYRITGNGADAEEIVQDAFVRLHDAEPKDAVRSLKAYLATITASASIACATEARRETPCRGMAAGASGDRRCAAIRAKTFPSRCAWCWSGCRRLSASCSCCTTLST